jgi:N-acetyltransferase
MAWLEPITLHSAQVSLVPLTQRYRGELIEAVKDGELFKLWYTLVPAPEIVEREIERRLGLQAAGAMLPFAVIDNASGKAVGMTNYWSADAVNRRVENGGEATIAGACVRDAGVYRGRVQDALF